MTINNIFKAEYNYGLKEEQIIKKNIILSLFETSMVSPFASFFYPASKNKDSHVDQIQKDRDQLKMIGGEFVTMNTPDGDNISGIHLKANNFKDFIENHFDLIKEIDKEDNLIKKTFSLKPEFSLEKNYGNYTYLFPYGAIKKFTLDSTYTNSTHDNLEIPNSVELGIAKKTFFNTDGKFCFQMNNIPKTLPFTASSTASHPTVLITAGAINTVSSYKSLVSFYLMRGINVMMVDFRGYGDSTGNPTPYKTKLDLETAYQYLSKEKHVENKDLILHGHCLGTGPSTDLAARRKGVNVILDRGFSESRNVINTDLKDILIEKTPGKMLKNLVKKIVHIIYYVLPYGFNYDNAKNLSKIQGNIAIIIGQKDTFISESEIDQQINALPNTRKDQTIKLIDSTSNHNESWVSEALTTLQVDQFLSQIDLSRKVI